VAAGGRAEERELHIQEARVTLIKKDLASSSASAGSSKRSDRDQWQPKPNMQGAVMRGSVSLYISVNKAPKCTMHVDSPTDRRTCWAVVLDLDFVINDDALIIRPATATCSLLPSP
jgi:hypothetical protein